MAHSYNEVMDMNQRSAPKRREPEHQPVLTRISIEPVANGGHIVEHSFHNGESKYHEPERHIFGKDEGHKLIDHLHEHLGIKKAKPEPEENEDESGDDEEEGSAAGAAY